MNNKKKKKTSAFLCSFLTLGKIFIFNIFPWFSYYEVWAIELIMKMPNTTPKWLGRELGNWSHTTERSVQLHHHQWAKGHWQKSCRAPLYVQVPTIQRLRDWHISSWGSANSTTQGGGPTIDPHKTDHPPIIMTVWKIFPNINQWRPTSLLHNNLTEVSIISPALPLPRGQRAPKKHKIITMLTNSINKSSRSPTPRCYAWLKSSYWNLQSTWLTRLSWDQGKQHDDTCRCTSSTRPKTSKHHSSSTSLYKQRSHLHNLSVSTLRLWHYT